MLWRVWRTLLTRLSYAQKVDFSRAVIDGTLIPSSSFREHTGYSGKHHRTGTKVVSITDRTGLPLCLVVAPGNRHDYPLAFPALKRLKVGRRRRPGMLLADKGFDGTAFRRTLRHRGIRGNIPERQFQRRRKRGRPPQYDQDLGRERYVVERTTAWFKSFRRVKFRYDYSIASFRAFLLLACIVVCVKRFIT